MTLAVVGALFGALPASQPAQADVSYEPYYAWNGYRIYLSPARHSPDNVGCGGYKENSGSYGVAIAATNSSTSTAYSSRCRTLATSAYEGTR